MRYLTIITLIFYRFTFVPTEPEQMQPPYWINMAPCRDSAPHLSLPPGRILALPSIPSRTSRQGVSEVRITDLSADIVFDNARSHAEPLYVDAHGRILRFSLRPGQQIREHNAPESPFYAVVLQGRGVFTGGDGHEQEVGPGTLLVFAPGEPHAVRADAEQELVFVGFLHGSETARPERTGGRLGRT